MGKVIPSKHETSPGVQYRNLAIVGLDPKYNMDRTFADDTHEQLCIHYIYLNVRYQGVRTVVPHLKVLVG